MSEYQKDQLERAIASVEPGRRSFLRGLLAAAIAAGALETAHSKIIAADPPADPGKGKGKSKGKAKAKGKGKDGKGKGKGKGDGKGKGKNPSSFESRD